MKTKIILLYFTLLISISSVCFSIPVAWSQQDNWRKIKDDMPLPAVSKLIGEPSFFIRYNDLVVFYYSKKEPNFKKSDRIDLTLHGRINNDSGRWDASGFVVFIKKTNSKIFNVTRIKEPDFNMVKDVEKERPKKIRPKQRLEKWQIEKSWFKLKEKMSDMAIINILGEPTEKIEVSQGIYHFVYGNDKLIGGYVAIDKTNGDRNNIVLSWKEPFWYMLNKELYEEVTE